MGPRDGKKNNLDLYWLRWVRLERSLHNNPLIFAWLKGTMSPEELHSLGNVINKYFTDLCIIINKDGSGKVVRNI